MDSELALKRNWAHGLHRAVVATYHGRLCGANLTVIIQIKTMHQHLNLSFKA
jgi:hypothetical protein